MRGPAPLAGVYAAAADTLEKAGHSGVRHVPLPPDKLHEKVMLRMRHAAKDELNALRWGSGFLASAGSTSPFIGLFGTVWGIMATFQALGDAKSASLAVVAPGIASALIATAAGLAVAIPAVMAFNWVQAKVDAVGDDADTFVERMDFMTRTGYAGETGGVPGGAGGAGGAGAGRGPATGRSDRGRGSGHPDALPERHSIAAPIHPRPRSRSRNAAGGPQGAAPRGSPRTARSDSSR